MSDHDPIPFDLPETSRQMAAECQQDWLPTLIGLALRLKQAHWNLRGERFKSVHEQLDEILEDVRVAVDDVAERIVTLGTPADGLPKTVADNDAFEPFPAGWTSVDDTIKLVCNDLAVAVNRGRASIAKLGEVDPISEDLAIGIVGGIEKHHWMLRSQLES